MAVEKHVEIGFAAPLILMDSLGYGKVHYREANVTRLQYVAGLEQVN
jgi:hypothetical protein